jgi:uncharacterized membrane protein YjjP (DUF1212 family)
MRRQRTLTGFLERLTREGLANSSEGALGLREWVADIARAHGADAEVAVRVDSAVLTVFLDDRGETVAITATPDITRLDRIAALKKICFRAVEPAADLAALSDELDALRRSRPPYSPALKALGIVLFVVGFSASVQSTWGEVAAAALTGVVVALVVTLSDRFQGVRLLGALITAVAVSTIVLLLFPPDEIAGGPVLLMVPALFWFVPGDLLSASMYELGRGRIGSGSTRLVWALFSLLPLALGILIGASLTGTSTGELFDAAARPELGWIVSWLAWGLFAVGVTIAFAAPWRDVGWVAFLVYLAVATQRAGTILFGQLVGTFIAAAVVVVATELISRRPSRSPGIVMLLGAFFALTVGALGLRGLTTVVSGEVIEGYAEVGQMFTLGAAISLGLLTGAVLMRTRTR